MTADVDAAVDRSDLDAILFAAKTAGWVHGNVAGVDLLVDRAQPKARSAVHLLFLNEKVCPESTEAIPSSPPVTTEEGIVLAPVADLVLRKLTSFRLKDRVHIQDMDAVGLITTEIEEHLPPLLRDRLAEVRASE